MNRLIIFLLFFCVSLSTLWAQIPLRLTLEDAVKMGQQQSPRARIAGLELEAAKYDYFAFKAQYKPRISLSGNVPGFNRRIFNNLNDEGYYDFIQQYNFSSDLEVQVRQQVPLTGGFVFLSSGLNNFINLNSNLPPDRRGSSWAARPLSIGIFQPLFQLNNVKWDLTEEAVRFKLSQITYTEAMEDVAVTITQTYFNALSAYLNMERAQFNVASNDTIYEISKGRFSVGKIAENELLQSELNLMNAQANYESATLAYNRALAELRTQLNLPRGENIQLVVPEVYPNFDIEPDFAVTQAMTYSRLNHENELNRVQAQRSLAQAKRNNGFNADIRASFGLNGSNRDLAQSYNNLSQQEAVNLSLDIPIFQWGRGKAQVNAALARQKSEQERIMLSERTLRDDVVYQVGQVKQLRSQLVIATRSDTVAQRRYEISRNRYLVGKISIQDLFLAQQDKDAAQQNFVNTLSQYWSSLAELKARTLYDFSEMSPVLRDEMER